MATVNLAPVSVGHISAPARCVPWDVLRVSLNSEIFAGLVGGPLVVGFLTPQRNAMTLAAKDTTSSLLGLYRQVFSSGFLQGFQGISRPALAAMPQFTVIGPVFLVAEKNTGSSMAALAMAGCAESFFTYGAQRRNAVIAYNQTRAPAEQLAMPRMQMMGPGAMFHIMRNMTAMTGIRIFSPHSHDVVCKLPGASRLSREQSLVAADFASSVVAATLSMPFNHIFSWSACTPELQSMAYTQRARASCSWLFMNYKQQGVGLLARDLAVRINYTAFLFTLYRFVERHFVTSD